MQVGDQSEALDFLNNQTSEAAAGDHVIQTHISVVVLKGDRAWKLKRALKLPYADFSTPALRAAACEQEVLLNRRTAPSLYLGVRHITRQKDGSLCFDGEGERVDSVVEMRRFDEDTLFSRLAAAGKLDRPLLTELARRIAAFHQDANVRSDVDGAASIEAVLSLNEQCTHLTPVFGATAVQRLQHALRNGLEHHRHLLDERARGGSIRHCHGDLHLRNLCLVDGKPTLFDCIEFNESFAVIDVLYDLAFLLMDLWQAGLEAEANWVMNRYLDERDEADGLPLLPFFIALRASIRAQVLATQLELGETAAQENTIAQAKAYLALALRALKSSPTSLLAIGGPSGSGKSTVAAAIGHRVGALPGARILATDRLRKRMAGVPAETRLPAQSYTRASSDQVYATLEAQAATALARGCSVIADAVFWQPQERERIEQCADTHNATFLGVWLEAPPETLIPRVQARRNDPSDATVEVLKTQLSRDPGPISWLTVPAGGTSHATTETVFKALALKQEPAQAPSAVSSSIPDWSDAPEGWNWLAQDADGRWFWYAVEPRLGMAGGVWRSPRRAQQFASQGAPNPLWHESCLQRP